MASTYSPSLRLELIGDGDQSGIWGQTTNNNLAGYKQHTKYHLGKYWRRSNPKLGTNRHKAMLMKD